jgi:putative endonuclease
MPPETIATRIAALWERIARFFRRAASPAPHLRTGRRGEQLADSFLRRQGYTILARNWRCQGRRGEIDLIGWDGDVLCFIEVKTRSSHGMVPAELAVNRAKQHELRGMAALYLLHAQRHPPSRFDVVSVYLVPGQSPEIDLFKDAFPWRTMGGKRRLRF